MVFDVLVLHTMLHNRWKTKLHCLLIPSYKKLYPMQPSRSKILPSLDTDSRGVNIGRLFLVVSAMPFHFSELICVNTSEW